MKIVWNSLFKLSVKYNQCPIKAKQKKIKFTCNFYFSPVFFFFNVFLIDNKRELKCNYYCYLPVQITKHCPNKLLRTVKIAYEWKPFFLYTNSFHVSVTFNQKGIDLFLMH